MAEIKKIETSEAPGAVGPYSQGTQFDRLIFVSGQVPIDPKTGNIPSATIEALGLQDVLKK